MAELDVVLGKGGAQIKIGGKEVELSPLRLSDFAEFRGWVKKRKLALIFEAAKESGTPLTEMDGVLDHIINARPTVVGTDEDGSPKVVDVAIEEMSTEEGIRYLLYLSLRRKQPDIKLVDIDVPYTKLVDLSSILGKITGFSTEDEEEQPKQSRPPAEK